MAERSSCFTCLVYPDSAPPNWLDLLGGLHIQAAVSPLHDMDIIADTGEYKKPHYHVVLRYSSLKSYPQVRADMDVFGGVYPPDDNLFRSECVVRSLPTMLKYLCHLDNPEKAQYSVDDVVCFGGLSYSDSITEELSLSSVVSQVCSFISETRETNFMRLCLAAQHSHPEWLPFLVKYAFFFKTFLQSSNMVSSAVSGFVPLSDDIDF